MDRMSWSEVTSTMVQYRLILPGAYVRLQSDCAILASAYTRLLSAYARLGRSVRHNLAI